MSQRMIVRFVLAVLLLTPASFAGVTATLTQADSTGNAVSLLPGESFNVAVHLSASPETLISAQMRLLASSSGILSVTAGQYAPNWAEDCLPIPIGPLNPRSGELGALPAAPVTGSFSLATLTLKVDPSAPRGDYTLNLTDIVAGSLAGDQIDPAGPGPAFQITVVPEPATLALLLGMTLLARRRMRG